MGFQARFPPGGAPLSLYRRLCQAAKSAWCPKVLGRSSRQNARYSRAARRLPDPTGACAAKMQVTAKRGPGGDPAGMDAGRLAAEAWMLSLQVGPRRAE